MENRERVRGNYREFYLPPMEQIELGGATWLIFEAQGQLALDFAMTQKYGLADDLQGAKAYYFWAVGAPTPFPFVRDPLRKEVALTQVSFAALSETGEARSGFREVLRGVTVAGGGS